MFVSVPFLVAGCAILLLVGICIGGYVGAMVKAALWEDGFWHGYAASKAADEIAGKVLFVGEEE